jgi:hypothetical protein
MKCSFCKMDKLRAVNGQTSAATCHCVTGRCRVVWQPVSRHRTLAFLLLVSPSDPNSPAGSILNRAWLWLHRTLASPQAELPFHITLNDHQVFVSRFQYCQPPVCCFRKLGFVICSCRMRVQLTCKDSTVLSLWQAPHELPVYEGTGSHPSLD